MNASVIAVGQLREKPFRAMADEYLKRLSRYGKYREIELNDLPEPANSSPALEEQIRRKEGEAILKAIRPGDYVIALTIPGRQWDSPALARHLEVLAASGRGDPVFVIGGSLGLSPEVIARADEELSMSAMTFPHQLARVMLLEQLYRCCRITAGERYHK
ncbi:MAG: 23S rRNA (pseudouridine(1915)-N(3))-methyltransferase RlmH [Clostridia bacterium]|nr:23S rRNA (pseudouridine(1915)-N(3))-methyltransferase RlmH [Clostridia bacterium]